MRRGRPIRKWKRICSSSRRTIVRLVFQCCEAKSHSKGFKLHGTVGDVLEQMEKRLFEIMMKKDSHSSYSKILKPIVGSEVIFMVGPVMNVLWDQATNEFYGKFSESVDTHVLLLVTTVNTKHICVDRLIETRDSEHIFLKAIMELGRGQVIIKMLNLKVSNKMIKENKVSRKQRVEKSEEEYGRKKDFEEAIFK
ncbi:hypothetical protein Bca4012_049854 [Brassica carinata]